MTTMPLPFPLRPGRRALATLALLAVSFGFAASPSHASLARETRPVSAVERVVLNTVGALELTQGSDESLIVEAEPRVLARITTNVNAGTLTIDTNGEGFHTREPVRYTLRVKRLAALESHATGSIHTGVLTADRLQLVLSGSADMRIDGLTARSLAVDAGGAGSIEIGPGRVDQATIRASGTVDYAAPKLRTRDARVDVSGTADAVVAVDKSLAASVAGAGRVGYRGDPVVTQRVEGAGSIEREE